MKRILLVVVLLIGHIGIAQQTTDAEKEKFRAEIKEKFEDLKLSETQKVQFEAIQLKYFDEIRVIRDSGEGRFTKMKSFKKMQENKNIEMKDILNEEQYDKYIDIQKELQKELKKRYKQNK